MGRVNKRTWFCTEKERERRQTVSRRLRIRLAISKDHSYSKPGGIASDNQPNSTTPAPHVPDIGHVNDDVIIDGEISSEPDSTWSTGRRIVELGVLAEALKSCNKCGIPLHLHHAIGINTYGLAAILKIPCGNSNCNHVNNIPTGKRHGVHPSRTWDVNSKLGTGIVYTAHNAIDDVSALKTLVQSYFTSSKLDNPDIQRCSVTVQSVIASYLYSCQIRVNLPSLQPLVAQKIISQGIARKIAGSGLQYTHLQTAFNDDTQNGISNLCREQCGSSVRVTKSKKIISSLNNHFAQCNES